MANQSIYNAFERMWQHVIAELGNKANKTEIDTAIAELEEQVDYVGLQISEHKHSWNTLKDKPFYTEEKYTTLVPETTVTIQDFIEDAIDIDLVVGNTYFVIWDGIKYECICHDNNVDPVIGNDACWGGNGGNGEPFLVSNYDGITAINVYDNGTHTISISAIIENIHQLDEKYIPDSVNDWNTLKNKPFGEETKKTVIIEEQTITFDNNSKAYPTVTGQYSIGTNVAILFDGIEYEAEVKDGFFLGDNYIVSRFNTIDNIEITIVWDGFCIYALLADTHTISVYIKETVIHKLPEEFLPDHSHSWNDLEDKPFGEILGYEICNKEQTFTVELSNGGKKATANLQKDVYIDYFRVNLPTVVTLDGVEYTDLDIYESGGDMCIYIEFTNENGDNITIINNDSIYMPSLYAGTTHTIEIKQETKVVKKIDEEFLPESVATKEFVEELFSNLVDGNEVAY